jgi:hypothetical protein
LQIRTGSAQPPVFGQLHKPKNSSRISNIANSFQQRASMGRISADLCGFATYPVG